ncbi:MAG: carboxymuconolactone decarboxylase family protein [Anaerolineae bacterium]|nr:carboxymuconolactone decarboxylase family protein [Anaerolineae bacterium]
MQTTFKKRIFDMPTFKATIDDVVDHMDDLKSASRSGRISKAFSERIMLAVTQVNGCRYCEYGHTRSALAAGVSDEEIRSIMSAEFDDLPQDEVVALMYAQHVAESKGNPDPDATQRLEDTYGPDTARDIQAYIRMIMFGNLYGNTFDAFLNRLTFKPVSGSRLGDELGVLFGGIVLMPVGMLRRRFRRGM